MRSRPFSSLADLAEMQSLISEAWLSPARPTITVTVGDLEWWMCQGGQEADWPSRVRLWSEGERPIAWGWFNPPCSLELFVRPGLADERDIEIRDEILTWGIERIGEGEAPADSVQIWAADDWREQKFLIQRGFTVGDDTLTHFFQPLDRELPTPDLPNGYEIRALSGPGEIPARVQVHRAAFAPSKMTIEKYEILIGLPHYAFNNDVVVVAPDGSFAAFTMCWFDSLGAVGELEPVGTHPDHRRLGLGKAANTFGLQLLQELGAREAVVFSDRENAASEALYRSVGFGELALHRQFRRTIR